MNYIRIKSIFGNNRGLCIFYGSQPFDSGTNNVWTQQTVKLVNSGVDESGFFGDLRILQNVQLSHSSKVNVFLPAVLEYSSVNNSRPSPASFL